MSGDAISSTGEAFIFKFVKLLTDHLKENYRLRFGDISSEQLNNEIQGLVDTLLPTEAKLTTSRPDFDSNLFLLMRELEKGNAWKDTSLSSTGQFILRQIAADIDFSQFSIMRALQEAYPFTARNPSSIIAAARSNGLRITRNTPCKTTVKITRQDVGLLSIPKWMNFDILNSAPFFNRDVISFSELELEKTFTLYQGEIRETSVVSTGVPMQLLEIGEESHNISDVDIRVFVDDVEWSRSDTSIWNTAEDAEVFWENTLPNGNVEIRFGDGVWGKIPPSGMIINVKWAETKGKDGEDERSGLIARWVNDIDTLGTVVLDIETTEAITGGTNRLSVNYYKAFAGDRRGSDGGALNRAILRKDFRAHACAYPGVFDAVFRGQAELNPGRRSWMNIVGVTLLTDPVFTELQWNDFVDYIKGGGNYPGLTQDNLEILRMDPTSKPMDIKATIACRIDADLGVVKNRLKSNLVAATRPRIGSLGFSWYLSDVYDILSGKPPSQMFSFLEDDSTDYDLDLALLVEYVVLEEPTEHSVLDTPLEWIKLGNVELDVKYSNTRRGGYEGNTRPITIPGVTVS